MAVRNVAVLPLKVVVGKHNVAGVAHNADDLAAAVIEVFVRLDDARSRRAAQSAAGLRRGIGNQALNILEGHIDRGIHEVRDQEARPGVSRTRVGHEESVIWKYGEVALGNIGAEDFLHQNLEMVVHRALVPSTDSSRPASAGLPFPVFTVS